MKKLLAIITLFAAAIGWGAGVDYIVSGTTTVPAGGSNLVNAPIIVAYSSDVSVQGQFKLTGAGTSPVTFLFDSSNDYANWSSNTYRVTVTANGTTTVDFITNFNLKALPYLRLAAIHNTNATIVTNLLVSTVWKRGL